MHARGSAPPRAPCSRAAQRLPRARPELIELAQSSPRARPELIELARARPELAPAWRRRRTRSRRLRRSGGASARRP
eukprot:1760650-Alexandrium_andersonii.AAC.1